MSINRKKLGNFAQVCEVKRLTYNSGIEKGLNILEISNGLLNFTLLEDRCLDIGQLFHKGTNISFITKNGFYSPKAAFVNAFCGGMLYTCGLDSLSMRDGHEMHGRIHNVPAKIESIRCDEKIEVIALIKDTALFGQNLELRRKIETEYNTDKITITDTLKNAGYKESGYALLYHINIGYPMLDSITKIKADIIKTEGSTEWAEKNKPLCLSMEEPVDNAMEQVFYHTLKEGKVEIINEKINKTLTIFYDNKVLPFLAEWKSIASGDYALAIEPSTSKMGKDFKYLSLKPQESIEFAVELDFK